MLDKSGIDLKVGSIVHFTRGDETTDAEVISFRVALPRPEMPDGFRAEAIESHRYRELPNGVPELAVVRTTGGEIVGDALPEELEATEERAEPAPDELVDVANRVGS